MKQTGILKKLGCSFALLLRAPLPLLPVEWEIETAEETTVQAVSLPVLSVS